MKLPPQWSGRLLFLLLAVALPASARQNAPLSTAPILDPEKEGFQLAARLRDSVPAEPAEFTGTLVITTRDDRVSSVPISSRVNPGRNGFSVSYSAPAESLLIAHTAGSSNAYTLNGNTIGPSHLNRPFAGSDFWLCDLGLEFFHWPGQRLLRNEMRRSRSCWVLESVTPAPGSYARVLSWIDVEHNGILRAEAYGTDGKLLKEFLLGSMRKVEGRWQLESMKMRNVRTDSVTELKFDLSKQAGLLDLPARARIETAKGSGQWQINETTHRLVPQHTAIVICDMWDTHTCSNSARRVAEMAPRMNEVVKKARAQGAFIIHCPSDTMKFYEGTPGRKLAQAAPKVEPKVPLQRWCHLDKTKEAALPIDDSDGGCDAGTQWPKDKPYPWTRQIATIEIKDGDAINESAEAYYLMRERGITNVIVMGVHLNMCVLGRPFSIRQMVAQGQNVFLVRDMTDTMYNPRRAPYVPHCVGNDLMVEHVEKYWCPTIASTAFLGGEEFRFKEDVRPHAVFLIGEDEYRTWETLPPFATNELAWRGIRVSIIQQSAADKHRFPGFTEAMRDADLLFVSVRRRALPKEQLDLVRAHLNSGKPLIGIRTASHAFDPRGKDAERGDAWPEFGTNVIACSYNSHWGAGPKTAIEIAKDATAHEILTGVDAAKFTSNGSLYRVNPLKPAAKPLLIGTIPDKAPEPVAWTYTYGPKNARIFYTSLGHWDDFNQPAFRRLLLNATHWAVGRPVPPATTEVGRRTDVVPAAR